MNSRKTSSLLQVVYAAGYGSIMGLGIGTLFSIGVLGGVWVLSRIIQAVAFPG
jgi:hypothetical protein